MKLRTNINGKGVVATLMGGGGNGSPSPQPSPPGRGRGPQRRYDNAVALVITLLMLSVITFLAVAFLAMTKRSQSAVDATLDVDTARTMSEAASARAQAEIIAQMMAQTDILAYDYMASHNYITPTSLWTNDNIQPNSNNVSYDAFWTVNGPGFGYKLVPGDEQAWAQNIANLYYDPRPPVFIMTNGNLANPQDDFRYWVDLNRNGKFESNGFLQTLDNFGNFITGVSNYYNGEPEWVGVLKYPTNMHSPTNPFIGRYAYMVLPIGKTLDLNYIHNYSKYAAGDSGAEFMTTGNDSFSRDQGIGSWELNLGALLYNLSDTMYQTNLNLYNREFDYNLPTTGKPNLGEAFDDASQFLAYRYGYNGKFFPSNMNYLLGNSLPFGTLDIDLYGIGEDTAPLDLDYEGLPGQPSQPTGSPWPGGYNSNTFYDVQDLFNTSKTGVAFPTNLMWVSTNFYDSYDRYTFQRLLACIGTSSQPEYGVYVYSNLPTYSNVTLLANVPRPSLLRTKVNINFDNSAQIQAGPYDASGHFTPMPTNLVSWANSSPIHFFTNAADLLLRSQVYAYTNFAINALGIPTNYTPDGLGGFKVSQFNYPYGYSYATFGLTNIPIYVSTNPAICYNEQVHRMLQLAANIYVAANPTYVNGYQTPVVFRPEFLVTNNGTARSIFIANYVQVTNDASLQLSKGFKEITNTTILPDDNIWGIPWVVAAVKGIPEFDQYIYNNQVHIARLLNFVRYTTGTPGVYSTGKPEYTNQYIELNLTNVSGMDAWNPYRSNFVGSGKGLYVVASNLITITISNSSGWTNIYSITNTTNNLVTNIWPGLGFMNLLQSITNYLPLSYFSESNQYFYPIGLTGTNGFQPGDAVQNTWPTHYWSISVTNHLFYALFDGPPSAGNLLDFVNLGPFGNYFPITQYLIHHDFNSQYWLVSPATDARSNTNISQGVNYQIGQGGNSEFAASVLGVPGGYPSSVGNFNAPGNVPTFGTQATAVIPFANDMDSNSWLACDPLVHYTIGDLYWPSPTDAPQNPAHAILQMQAGGPLTLRLGITNGRFNPAVGGTNILYGDPGLANPLNLADSSDNWQFPTNLFPSVGWLGRVHRGTPWQTVYLKSDNPALGQNWSNNWANSAFTYPTNDWSLVDLFTAVPNDNAARGLLSVNQTNDAAWAAMFAGVVAISNFNNTQVGVVLNPTTDISNLVDSTNGINFARSTVMYDAATPFNTNGLFHRIGDILQASALTVNSPYNTNTANILSDEMVERIPQQTLGLMKLGMPQFVIYCWGQSLKPKDLYTGGPPALYGLCTNYQITGEYLTRMVCHVVGDPAAAAPKIVVDNFNIVPSE